MIDAIRALHTIKLTRSVAIVDDDHFNLDILREVVEQIEGCIVTCFSSSKDALEWCKLAAPDLILVDYNMPAPDGLAFIEAMRKTEPLERLPIVMITSARDRRVRHQALDAGATDFLNKPIDEVEILARVRNLLATRSSRLMIETETRLLDAQVRAATADLREREKATIECLVRAAEYRDNETGSHIVRMGFITKILCKAIGYSEDAADSMRVAAQMHDIGKVSIPDSILLKAGPLTASEFDVMQTHTIAGYQILTRVDSPLLQQAAEIALTHHERFDGNGYPSRKKGYEISESGRIVALADVYDALMSHRPYKEPWPLEKTVDFVQNGRAKHFDPDIVDAFMRELESLEAVREQYRD